MMRLVISFLVGVLFGIGLIIAGMANPSKVLAFLDLAGAWDPSLLMVMIGAILLASIAFFFAKQRTTSLLGLPMQLPGAKHIDKRLIMGSLLFGVGWGLAGICPGPGLVLIGAIGEKGIIFVISMIIGMVIFECLEKLKAKKDSLKKKLS